MNKKKHDAKIGNQENPIKISGMWASIRNSRS